MLLNTMVDRASQWLSNQLPEMERLLRELVECSSCTTDPTGVNAAGEILRKATPGQCEVVPSRDYGNHLFFHGKRRAADQGVLLVGHMDTVFPKDVFQGYRTDGRIACGPGVLDMKGGLVVISFALRALQEVGLLDRLPFTYAVVSDEEAASPDSMPHLQRVGAGARAALVFEAGREKDAILTERKGGRLLHVRVHGRAAHSGNAHSSGANAIWGMGQFIDTLQRMTDYSRGITVSAGLIKGGIADNVVPPLAEAQIDTRFLTVADFQDLERRVSEAAKVEYVPGTRVEIEWGPGRLPMEKNEATRSLFNSYSQCQAASGLGSSEHPLVGGGSDGCTTAAMGIPTIDGLGPRGTGYHTVEELVELDSLIPKAQALLKYLFHEFHE